MKKLYEQPELELLHYEPETIMDTSYPREENELPPMPI